MESINQFSIATFGILATDGIVTDVAPIASWMKGKKLEELRGWLIGKKATVKEIHLKQ